MMPHAYTEDQLVEQPAIQLFAELGWETASALERYSAPDGTLGRETKAEVCWSPASCRAGTAESIVAARSDLPCG